MIFSNSSTYGYFLLCFPLRSYSLIFKKFEVNMLEDFKIVFECSVVRRSFSINMKRKLRVKDEVNF